MQEKYEIKMQMLGEDSDLKKTGAVLNRKIEWSKEGVWFEADPKHTEEVLKALNLTDASPVTTPAVPDSETRQAAQDKEEDKKAYLEPEGASLYRSVAARLNYLAEDRPDIATPTLQVCRVMANPCEEVMKKL